jgi:hypothetical protein
MINNTIVFKSDKIKVTPDHDFAELKKFRLELFEEETQRFIDAGVNIDREISWKEWLNDELDWIDMQMKKFDDLRDNSRTLYKGLKLRAVNTLEYKQFIEKEILKNERKIAKEIKKNKL